MSPQTMRAKSGVPFLVRLRTYGWHFLISAVVLAVNALLFLFVAEHMCIACTEVRRASAAPCNEVVFSELPTASDTFYYLNQMHLVGARQTQVDCDILMADPATDYGMNAISFGGNLAAGECAVSRNLAEAYGLALGDEVKALQTDMVYRVAAYLPAQTGLDRKAGRAGIVVVSYAEEMLKFKYSYVSFALNGDEYAGMTAHAYLPDWGREGMISLLTDAAVCILAFLACTALGDYFLFRLTARHSDFHAFAVMGMGQGRLFGQIFGENFLKYLLPLLLAVGLFAMNLKCYGIMYALPMSAFAALAAGLVLLYSWYLTRRSFYGGAKKRTRRRA